MNFKNIFWHRMVLVIRILYLVFVFSKCIFFKGYLI